MVRRRFDTLDLKEAKVLLEQLTLWVGNRVDVAVSTADSRWLQHLYILDETQPDTGLWVKHQTDEGQTR